MASWCKVVWIQTSTYRFDMHIRRTSPLQFESTGTNIEEVFIYSLHPSKLRRCWLRCLVRDPLGILKRFCSDGSGSILIEISSPLRISTNQKQSGLAFGSLLTEIIGDFWTSQPIKLSNRRQKWIREVIGKRHCNRIYKRCFENQWRWWTRFWSQNEPPSPFDLILQIAVRSNNAVGSCRRLRSRSRFQIMPSNRLRAIWWLRAGPSISNLRFRSDCSSTNPSFHPNQRGKWIGNRMRKNWDIWIWALMFGKCLRAEMERDRSTVPMRIIVPLRKLTKY